MTTQLLSYMYMYGLIMACRPSLQHNQLGDAGAEGIGKGLKSNTALQTLQYVALLTTLSQR